jgi:hypothetical protein
MNMQRNQRNSALVSTLGVGLLLIGLSANPAIAAGTITDPTEADRVLLERARIAKEIVVEGQPGPLQAEQERKALERAQQGWQNMNANQAAAAERKAAWEAAKQEAARLKQEREARYWESAANMERLLARQQQIAEEQRRNEQAARQRDLQQWTVVGEATEAGFAEQQQRERIRQENLKRYQESLQGGWGAVKPEDGTTVQQQIEAARKARELQLLRYNLSQWNYVMRQSDEGRDMQEAIIQANRENQIRHMSERVREWNTIDRSKAEQVRDLEIREQVRRANAERYQQQLRQEYSASRVGGQVLAAPEGASTAPADLPGR